MNFSMQRLFLFIIFIFTFQFFVVAQNPIDVSNFTCRNKIEQDDFLIFEDSTNLLKYKQILSEDFYELECLKTELNESSTYWLKIKLENNNPEDKIIIFDFIEITDIQVFYVDKDSVLNIKKTGWFVPFSQKHLTLGSKYYSDVVVPSDSELTVYIKLYNDFDVPPKLQIHISPIADYYKTVFFETFLHGVFQGLLWMLLLFGLFYLFVVKNNSYMYFIAFMLLFSVFFLSHYRVLDLIFGTLKMTAIFMYWLIFPALIMYLNFSRLFLNLKKEMPKLNHILVKTIWVGVFAGAIAFVAIFFSYKLYMTIFKIYTVYYAIVFIVLVFVGFKIKNKISGFYLKGSFFFMIGGGIAFLGTLNIFDFDLTFLEAGLVGQFFFFTVGMQYKNQQDREKANRKIITQLKENKALQTKVNRELEEKVQERTKEIQAQNEEILAQSERLQAANDEITTQRDDIQLKSSLLEEKNNQITSSIVYASRIQKAILGNISEITENFSDAFIFFSPHSIVSGDFYWFNKVEDYEIIIAADCTGHGVPGAFMTVMGHDFLEDIVSKGKVFMPDEILHHLDKKLRNRLQSQSAENKVDDGMDISVVTINKKQKKLWFSGAKNNLFYVSDGVMNVIKASKHSIGGDNLYVDADKIFDLNEILYKDDDKFYIFSDGFQDQFGGENYTKFLTKNFRNLLFEISEKPMKEQHQILSKTLKEWKGNNSQTDDILIIGFQV